MADLYQPAETWSHASVLVDEKLYLWAGSRQDIPRVHSSAEKLRATAYVDVFHCRLGMWEQLHTTGTPPLGVEGYASCHFGGDIFYFAGWCGHGGCYHNSLYCLSTETLSWKELFPTNKASGPMRKVGTALLPFDGQLLAIAGIGSEAPTNPSPVAKYSRSGWDYYTNEHHIFNREKAEWTIPTVTGDIPPPIAYFSFTQISSDTAVMFGGNAVRHGASSELYLATVGRDSVHWQRLGQSGPSARWRHAATSFTHSKYGSHLLVVGGSGGYDNWICDMRTMMWEKISSMPDKVEGRQGHSINAVGVRDNCVWVMVMGGWMKSWVKGQDIALFELTLNTKGHWEVTDVREDREIYPGYAERFWRAFPAQMTEYLHKVHQQLSGKGAQQQLIQQQLMQTQQKLELIQQQSAEKEGEMVHQLLETRTERDQLNDELTMVKKKSRAKDLELDEMQVRVKAFEEALFEKKQNIMTLDAEVNKLQAQIEKMESASAEEDAEYQAIVEKSEAPVAELGAVKILYQRKGFEMDKLKQEMDKLKEKLEERETSVAKVPASTSDAAIQANYLSATEGPVMEELASTVLEITGGKHQSLKWSGNGFRLTVPAGAVPEGTTVSLAVRAFLAEGFHLPENCQLISAIYWIGASQRFEEEITLHLQHCAVIQSDAECSQFKFIAGRCNQPEFPYQLKVREGGVFTPHSHEASISIKQFSIYGAVGDGGLSSYYLGQGFYRHDEDQSWILDYTITQNVDPLVTWVHDDYTSGGWTKHHTQMLEYDETNTENAKPSVIFEVAEPANDRQKDWEVTVITANRFEKSVVDQLTEKHNIPVTSFGMEWIGSSDATRYSAVRKIKLLGMKGPYNNFFIFLPKKALTKEKNREALTPTPTVPPPVPTTTLDAVPDGPLASTPSSARSPPLPMSTPQTVPEAGLAPIPSAARPSPVPVVTPYTSAQGQLAPTPAPTVPPPVLTAILDTLPDGPLEATHLHGVLRYLEKQSLVSRWRRIGLVLQLTYDKLDVIQRDRDSVEDCAAAMLHQWLTSGRATKQALVEAVQEVKN